MALCGPISGPAGNGAYEGLRAPWGPLLAARRGGYASTGYGQAAEQG